MYTVLLNYLHAFELNIFLVFNTLYLINIGYWQALFVTSEQLGKSESPTSTFKFRGSTAAVLILFCFFHANLAKTPNY